MKLLYLTISLFKLNCLQTFCHNLITVDPDLGTNIFYFRNLLDSCRTLLFPLPTAYFIIIVAYGQTEIVDDGLIYLLFLAKICRQRMADGSTIFFLLIFQ